MRDFAIRELTCASEEEISDINCAIRYHLNWFREKLGKTNCSAGFIVELAWHTVKRGYNVHIIHDEIAVLEGKSERKSATKPASKFRRAPLAGLWHKHHFQAQFMATNILIEINKPGALEAQLAKFMGRIVGDVIGEMVEEIVDGSLRRRKTGSGLTGEFIVFERDFLGENYYLTLGSHGEYEKIQNRIEFYRILDREVQVVESECD